MRHRLIFLLSFSFFFANGQEQLGLRLENYAGVSSLAINPTGHLNNPLNWDINLAGAAVFVENNYFFFENTKMSDLLNASPDALVFSRPEIGSDAKVGNKDFVVDYFDEGKKHFGTVSATIMGPSVVVKLNDQHSIGVFTNIRAYASLQRLPSALGYYHYNLLPRFENIQLEPFIGAAISWKELGLNYALKVPTANGNIGLGINVRFLQGIEGVYFKGDALAGHEKQIDNVRLFESPEVRFGFTNSNLQGNDFSLPKNNGGGFATDLGFVYTIDGEAENYKLRLGASIIDLGFLNFDKNAQDHLIQLDGDVILDWEDYEVFEGVEEFEDMVQLLSSDVYGDPNASSQGSDFQVLLPAAFSLQADYAFHSNVYLNALLIQRIPFNGVIAERGNLFALTPRFEHRWFSASLPVSVYNWQNLNVGLAARLAWLVIGTDNLGSWISKSNLTGTDFYVAMKVNFSDLSFGEGGVSNKRRRRGGKVKCYDF